MSGQDCETSDPSSLITGDLNMSAQIKRSTSSEKEVGCIEPVFDNEDVHGCGWRTESGWEARHDWESVFAKTINLTS
jgi:hypothetical protein